MDNFKILDCTLRDGGYYNNWDFSSEVVDCYLQAMSLANIDYVELGLRNFPKKGFLGAYAYTTENHINSMDLPEGPVYGVMVDAKTILSSGFEIEEAVEKLFVPVAESALSVVRVAAHFKEVEHSGPIVKKLKQLGYTVGYNLMQAGGKPDEVIAEKAQIVSSWDVVDVLYFADSLGNMDSHEVERIIDAIRISWKGTLGIHTHNNMGQGLSNTLSAKCSGVSWLDTTITGMGRGAGNTPTENLLAVLDKNESKYNPKPVYEVVIRHFEAMQREYGWGSNLLYFLGAQNHVHPTYIQNLLSNTHFGTDEIVGAIDYLSKLDGTTTYSGRVLDSAISFNDNSTISGSSETLEIAKSKNVVMIANGPSTRKYANSIEAYIRKAKPLVLALNIVESIDSALIDYYVITHNSKFLADMNRYVELKKPIILPKHRFSTNEIEALSCLELKDFGIEVRSGVLEALESSVVIPSDITAAYILAMLLNSNPLSISLIGFDGYDSFDPRQQEMAEIINLYQSNSRAKPLVSLTPTSYQVIEGSIYAPVE
jgi:4-hydroxy 2-oxovalerate aldolase